METRNRNWVVTDATETARPWEPLGVTGGEILDVVEGLVRFTVRCLDERGAVIDPVVGGEHQYATPYFAHALGVLLSAGRCADLAASGIRAMEWATHCFAINQTQCHRPFFIHALVECLPLYQPYVSSERYEAWRERLRTPVAPEEALDINWSTYLMLGEWLRAHAGLIDRDDAVRVIEAKWNGSQAHRIVDTPGNLYHDHTSDPDTLAVEAVGRGNLLALALHGYDGPSAEAIRDAAIAGTRTSLLLQDPSGQAPCNGRTDNHVWVDIGYMLAFDTLAEYDAARGDLAAAGQLRRAASLAFRNIQRWERHDPGWEGSYFVTKNRFPPTERLGYQAASQWSNYNGALMHHLAQAYVARRTEIAERPAPCEVGGYAVELDESFACAVVNAGGMQMQINLRGDTELGTNPDYWSALGVVRIGRPGWDTRMGPSDGIRVASGEGISFAPEFVEDGAWVRMASVPHRYRGEFEVEHVQPDLVRCSVTYLPIDGHGPEFRQAFTVTPSGILCTTARTGGHGEWGVTLPLLAFDGEQATALEATGGIASARLGDDEQSYLVVGDASVTLGTSLRGTYGDIVAGRATAVGDSVTLFVNPRKAGDPSAREVRESLELSGTCITVTA